MFTYPASLKFSTSNSGATVSTKVVTVFVSFPLTTADATISSASPFTVTIYVTVASEFASTLTFQDIFPSTTSTASDTLSSTKSAPSGTTAVTFISSTASVLLFFTVIVYVICVFNLAYSYSLSNFAAIVPSTFGNSAPTF